MRQEDLPKANATCEVCGRKYYVCRPCIELRDRGTFGYRLVCCSLECYKVYTERLTKDPELVDHVRNEVMNPEHEYKEIEDSDTQSIKKSSKKRKKTM